MFGALGNVRDHELTVGGFSYPYPDGAMNMASTSFLESDCDEMIVIDTDVVFPPSHLAMLLSHDEPLVFGLYPKKKPGLEFPVEPLDGDSEPFANDGRPPLREVARCAKGFMRVNRSVFDKLKPHVEKIECAQTRRKQYLFWKTLPGGHSEDFAFCDLWRSIGGKILVDSRITCQHEGSALYPIKGTY